MAKRRRAKAGDPATPAERPSTDGSQLTPEALELANAIQTWKHKTGKFFPTASELLWIIGSIGYRKHDFDEAA